MLCGLETVPLTKKQEAELKVAELKMLRFSIDVTRVNKIKNEYIRGQYKKQIEGNKINMIWSHFENGKQLRRKRDDYNERNK